MDENCTLLEVTRRVRSYFYPSRLDVPDHVWITLERVYPTVDWDRVDFYEGWPHLVRHSGFQAITLPDPHSVHRINVYFTPEAWQPDRASGLSTILHEGYHVLQVQNLGGGYGLGLVRPFLILYLHCWAGNRFAYANHPMEEPAYRLAGRKSSCYEEYLATVDDGCVTKPLEDTDFAQTDIARTFWEQAFSGRDRAADGEETAFPSPGDGNGWMRAGLATVGAAVSVGVWTLVALVLWILFLAVEAIGLILVACLWIVARLACGIHRNRSGKYAE